MLRIEIKSILKETYFNSRKMHMLSSQKSAKPDWTKTLPQDLTFFNGKFLIMILPENS